MNLACTAIFPTSKSKNLWGNYELSLFFFFFLTNPRWLGYLENARIRYLFQKFPYLKTKHKQIPEKHVIHTWENLAKRIFRQKDAISFCPHMLSTVTYKILEYFFINIKWKKNTILFDSKYWPRRFLLPDCFISLMMSDIYQEKCYFTLKSITHLNNRIKWTNIYYEHILMTCVFKRKIFYKLIWM